MNAGSSRALILLFAGIFGVLFVALDAAGAHALQLDERAARTFGTAVRLGQVHCVLLVILGIAVATTRLTRLAALALIVGILLFSMGLSLRAAFDLEWAGRLAPPGGIGYMLGWLCLAIQGFLSLRAARAS